jgi:outer membrane protein W
MIDCRYIKMSIEKESNMPIKRHLAKCHPVSVFPLIAAFSALVLFAFPLAAVQKSVAAKDSRRMAVGFLGGVGLLNGYSGVGAAVGASFSYGFNRNIAVELAGFLISGKGEYDPDTISKGRLTTMPLQLSLMGRFPVGRKLTPYVLAGGSYFLNGFSMDDAVAANWNDLGFTLSEKVHGAFGFHFGAGLEYRLEHALAVVFDARYFLGKANGDWNIRENASLVETGGTFSGLDLSTMVLSLGLKYFFK